MKLSEIKGEAVFDVIADISEPIGRIASDEKLVQAIKQGGSNLQAFGRIVPVLLKDHKDDLIAILAAINLQTVEEYTEGITMPKLIADVMSLATDEELLTFFK